MNADRRAGDGQARSPTKHGVGIGVAGSGISSCGPAIGLPADITERESIRAMLDQVALAYGGLDAVAVTAGIFVPPDTTGPHPRRAVGAARSPSTSPGSYLVADEAATDLASEQGLPANLVLTTSANAVVAKKGSLAYDTSKAAANHLVRELAVELAPLVRVNGVAPATVVQGSAMFPRDRVIASLAKYDIAYIDDEPTEALTSKLAQFYADRTLLKRPITPADQAEAVFLLLSDRLRRPPARSSPSTAGCTRRSCADASSLAHPYWITRNQCRGSTSCQSQPEPPPMPTSSPSTWALPAVG